MVIEKYFTEADVEIAFETAKKNRLPVLVDFWSEGCKGCKKMELVTYANELITGYIQTNFVFVKFNTAHKLYSFRNTYLSSAHLWTPCFIVFSNDGSEVRKISGYLPPRQFINEMELGRAMACLRKAQSEEALAVLENLIRVSGDDAITQEALYWAGVCAFYADKKNLGALISFWEKLLELYPTSNWAERANCLDVPVN
jgi:thiol-disulfide isomerase/thioredoxin